MFNKEYRFVKTYSHRQKGSLLYRFLSRQINKFLFLILVILALISLGLLYGLNYQEIHSLYPVEEQNSHEQVKIKPQEKIYLKFSEPIKEDRVKQSFKIEPQVQGEIVFFEKFIKGYAKGVVFEPKSFFSPDQKYKISIENLESFYGTFFPKYIKEFETVNSLRIVDISPKNEEKNIAINPEISLKMNEVSDFFDFNFSFEPKIDFDLINKNSKEIILRPKKQLKQGADYKLKIQEFFIPEEKTGQKTKIPFKIYDYTFRTIEPVTVEKVEPSPDDQKATPYSEIKITFNRPVNYESAEKRLIIDKEVEGKKGWEDRTLIFSPTKLERGKEYTVIVKAGIKGFNDEGFLEKDYLFKFKTHNHPKEIIPKNEIKPAITKDKYIDIDISDQILTIFKDGRSYGSFQISSGKYGMPTPIGRFKVLNKQPVAYSSKYNLYMPFWIAFTGAGHGIHELPFWKFKGGTEYKERESHLGIRVSHGCVRLGVGPAEEVYNFTPVGTPVVVHE